jgi:hypothetical protein
VFLVLVVDSHHNFNLLFFWGLFPSLYLYYSTQCLICQVLFLTFFKLFYQRGSAVFVAGRIFPLDSF